MASEPSQPSRLPGQAAKATVEKRKPSKAEPTSAKETKKPAVAASGTASASKRKSEDPGDQERSELRPAEDRAEASKRKAADTEGMIETIIAEERKSWIDSLEGVEQPTCDLVDGFSGRDPCGDLLRRPHWERASSGRGQSGPG